MLVDVVLDNAKIFNHGQILDGGIAFNAGRIFKMAKTANLPSASSKIDLRGQLVLPGLIDSHVHLRDQQLAYKEDFQTGTAAAAKGGVTLAIDMPNNQPVTMDSQTLSERKRLTHKHIVVNVAFFSAFPKCLRDILSVVNEGAVAFKLYMNAKIGGLDPEDDESLCLSLTEASKTGVPVAVHAEDGKRIHDKQREMERIGRNDLGAYVTVHSLNAEVKAANRIIHLAKNTGVHIHLCHVSSSAVLEAVLQAKERGLPVTCEVTPHHLFLSSQHLTRYGTLALTNPPLRPPRHSHTLWAALKQGLIDTVASDHAPHTIHEKETETVWEAAPGIPGLETMLPLLLDQVNRGNLSIAELVRISSEQPAAIFGLRRRGSLNEGNFADVIVVDMNGEYQIDSSNFESKAKYSPFDGWKVRGKLTKTFVNGHLIMDDGVILQTGIGQVVRSPPCKLSHNTKN